MSQENLECGGSQMSSFFKVLSNDDRIRILMHLMQTECTVAQLGEVLNIKQPSLSQQLGVLRRSGLVTTRKKGKYVFYGNVRMEARKILEMVEDVFPVTQQKRRKQKI